MSTVSIRQMFTTVTAAATLALCNTEVLQLTIINPFNILFHRCSCKYYAIDGYTNEHRDTILYNAHAAGWPLGRRV